MQIGLYTNCFYNNSWEEVCRFAKEVSIKKLEVVAGGLNSKSQCNPFKLIRDKDALQKFKDTAKKHEIDIVALGAFGNPLHPQKEIAEEQRNDIESAVELAKRLEVEIVGVLSGCPGAGEDAIYPNWIGLAYPLENNIYLKWQWENKIIPFWKKMVNKAKKYGIKFAFEVLPGYAVYNPFTLLKLREEVNSELIGCNFDPAHLFYQGIDPIIAIKQLKDLIINVHAQDIRINKNVIDNVGFFDTRSHTDIINRSWNLKLVGQGHDETFWNKFIIALREIGYNGVISIEHQDPLITKKEGIEKAYNFLNKIILHKKTNKYGGIKQ